jgi:hypothetical protein
MQVVRFIQGLKREFYCRRLGNEGAMHLTEKDFDDLVFASEPAHGAAVATSACIITR